MMSYGMLSMQTKLLFCGGLYVAAGAVLFSCLLRFCSGLPRRSLPADVLLFFGLVYLAARLTVAAPDTADPINGLPLACAYLPGVLTMIYASAMIRQTVGRLRSTLTQASVREALDNLGTGICYADEHDRIILINRTMARLASGQTGNMPRSMKDIPDSMMEHGVFQDPEGRRYTFRIRSLKGDELADYTQLTAQDVSTLYKINDSIARGNEALRRTNEALRKMYLELDDVIREQETTALKERIHHEMGTSLIEIADIIEGKGGDLERQLSVLQEAVGYFSAAGQAGELTWHAISERAMDIGVELIPKGGLPEGPALELTLLAARECATNCVRHAQGHTVTVECEKNDAGWYVSFTNDGQPPDGDITEGVGLATLRRRIEAAGGTMMIEAVPRFRLILQLPNRSEQKEYQS